MLFYAPDVIIYAAPPLQLGGISNTVFLGDCFGGLVEQLLEVAELLVVLPTQSLWLTTPARPTIYLNHN